MGGFSRMNCTRECSKQVGGASAHPDDARYLALRQLAPGLPFSGDGGEPRGAAAIAPELASHTTQRTLGSASAISATSSLCFSLGVVLFVSALTR